MKPGGCFTVKPSIAYVHPDAETNMLRLGWYSSRRRRGCGGGGYGRVGIWSYERHYHELESQSLALCMICTVARNMDYVFMKRLL